MKTCKAEETREIPATGHHPEKIEGTEATCTENGTKTYYRCADGNFEDEGCTAVIEDLESWITVPATGHHFGEWKVKTPATCTEPGIEARVCEICGHEETRETEAKGHSYGEWKVRKEATCTETGEEVRICETCKAEETRVLPATGHHPEKIKGTEATCTENEQLFCSCT